MNQKVLKEKKCRNCEQKFKPVNSTNTVCSLNCAIAQSKIKQAEKEKKEIKEKHKEYREKTKTNSDYIKITQQIFNKYIRLRDQNEKCISCDNKLTGKYDAGHYFSCGAYPALRFNEMNVHASCVRCNQHLHGNISEYTIRLPQRIGAEAYQHLVDNRNQPRKYTSEELKELISIYKEKIKELTK